MQGEMCGCGLAAGADCDRHAGSRFHFRAHEIDRGMASFYEGRYIPGPPIVGSVCTHTHLFACCSGSGGRMSASSDFPDDETCHEPGILGSLCREPVEWTLNADGGGWVAKLCGPHFDELTHRWERTARAQRARLVASPKEGTDGE